MFLPSTLSLAALLASLTLTATAAPTLTPRQETPRIYARYFAGGACEEPWREDTVFLSTTPVGECQNVRDGGPYGSTQFQGNLLDRTLRFYERACGADEEGGAYFEVGPGSGVDPGCFAQGIRSYKVL
ncbi:hypothetical protein NX059_009718 [Plenodomus lindquistii]|nr:hypothetical protein NX059_009718 [Plenodomus lindquistii]